MRFIDFYPYRLHQAKNLYKQLKKLHSQHFHVKLARVCIKKMQRYELLIRTFMKKLTENVYLSNPNNIQAYNYTLNIVECYHRKFEQAYSDFENITLLIY